MPRMTRPSEVYSGAAIILNDHNNVRSDDASSAVTPMIHPKDDRTFLKIFSSVAEEEVKCKDFRPSLKDERDIFRYICPICMRYFNSNNSVITIILAILESDCCHNYICIHCARSLQEIESKNPLLQINCPQCGIEDFCLFDVDLNKSVRVYFDSQILSENDLKFKEDNMSVNEVSEESSESSRSYNSNENNQDKADVINHGDKHPEGSVGDSPFTDLNHSQRKSSIIGSFQQKQRKWGSCVKNDNRNMKRTSNFLQIEQTPNSVVGSRTGNIHSFQLLSELSNYFNNAYSITKRENERGANTTKINQQKSEIMIRNEGVKRGSLDYNPSFDFQQQANDFMHGWRNNTREKNMKFAAQALKSKQHRGSQIEKLQRGSLFNQKPPIIINRTNFDIKSLSNFAMSPRNDNDLNNSRTAKECTLRQRENNEQEFFISNTQRKDNRQSFIVSPSNISMNQAQQEIQASINIL